MKLAYLSETVIPSRSASVVHVLKMCEAFSGLGHDVTLFYVSPDSSRLEEVLDSYGIRRPFRGIGIRQARRRTFLYEYGLRVALRVRALGPDLAVCRSVPACLVCALLGVPVVYEAHMPTRSRGAMTDRLFRLLLRLPALRGLVVISDALRQYFEERYPLGSTRILVLPDAA